MKMNRIGKRSGAGLVSILLLTASTSVLAYDGTVNFNGEIMNNTCAVTLASGSSMIVSMGKVSKSSLSNSGATSTPVRFALTLTGCPADVTQAQVAFDGLSYEGDNKVLALSAGTGAATGVGIRITDSSGNILPLNTFSSAYPISGTNSELPFYVSYIAMNSAITAGPANSNATFTISY